ncbi:DNA polymerase III beta subunit [Bacillus oleivorans]|uniref:Beta sliding clamp n=1 Tax=Bacillus oleivorans TaxID=1448271 RepID=A0A285CIE2_9BACI|nr:DNA polymerase III subunit beta [Bacillus oleivorans]SNX67290.1 DNA polymerase III beta subunit [Bacillus oleivorans]
MKVTIEKGILIKGVQSVLRAVSSRTTIPILTCIKLSVSSKGLLLAGSDSNISIEVHIQDSSLRVEEQGAIALHARVFYEIIKNLPDEPISISLNSKKAIIQAGKSEFKLNGIDAEEYPKLRPIEAREKLSLSASLLKQIIRQTAFAVSASETRPILTGVNWRLSEGILTCSATDSHLLALKKVTVEGQGGFNIVVPGKSLLELRALLPDTNELVELSVSQNQVQFSLSNIRFHARLLEGAYPDITRFISKDQKAEMVINTHHFAQAIKRASLLAKEGSFNVVKFMYHAINDIQIASYSPEFGDLTEDIEVESIDGEETQVSFNASYMAEALKAHDSAVVSVRFTGAMKPIIITAPEDESVLQLILPVRSY